MLKALVAGGATADVVVGASVGALNAAYFASDPTPAGVERLERIWRAIRRRDVFPVSFGATVARVLARRDYLVSPASLHKLIRAVLPFERLEDGRIPCHVMATDLLDGSPVRLSSGPAMEALLASAAIPGVFPPVHVGSRTLVDGGVAGSTPIAAAVALGVERVIVLSPGLPCATHGHPRGAVAMGLHALNLLAVNQLLADLASLRSQADILLVPPLCPLSVHSYDFSRTGELIDRAAASTRDWLAAGGLHRPAVPPALRPHSHVPERGAGTWHRSTTRRLPAAVLSRS
jgi:NTE family protein